jgi:hypothetical protein
METDLEINPSQEIISIWKSKFLKYQLPVKLRTVQHKPEEPQRSKHVNYLGMVQHKPLESQ